MKRIEIFPGKVVQLTDKIFLGEIENQFELTGDFSYKNRNLYVLIRGKSGKVHQINANRVKVIQNA